MVHCAYCCSCGSRRLVSFPVASFISATCPDFLQEKLSAIDVVQLALFSHSGTGRFLSLISDDSILLRARFDSQFRALLPASHFDPDLSRNNSGLEIRPLPSTSDILR